MKYNLFLLILFFHQVASAIYTKGVIITNEGEVIECMIDVRYSNPGKRILHEAWITKNIDVLHKKGILKRYKPSQIRSFTILNTGEGDITFEGHRINGAFHFVQVVTKGKYELFKFYLQPEISTTSHRGPEFHFAIREGNGPIFIIKRLSFISGWRIRLTELFPDDEYFRNEQRNKKYAYDDFENFLKNHPQQLAQ